MTSNPPPPGRIRWILIGLMFSISAIAYLDRVNISIAGSHIQKEFGLNNIQLGWVFSGFVLGYALFQAPGGRLADRFGPRRILLYATVWWAVFTALAASIPAGITGALAILLVTRFLLGVGEAAVFPASNRLVAGWIPSQERGLANGLIFAGVGAGAGITPPLIAYILLHYGWRWSFWLCALMGLVAGLVWYAVARDRPEDHPWVKEAEAEHIRRGLPGRTASLGRGALAWRVILANRNVWALTTSYFAFGYVSYIFFTWFFIYLNTVRGLDLKSSAFFSMLPFLGMAVFSPLGGTLSDRLTSRLGKETGRCRFSAVCMALAAAFIALSMQASDARLASMVLAGGIGALYLCTSCFWSVTADIAGRSAGAASGVMNMGNQVGGTITASLTPLLANWFGWSASFIVAALLCGIGAIAWLAVDPSAELSPERKPAADAFQTAPRSEANTIR